MTVSAEPSSPWREHQDRFRAMDTDIDVSICCPERPLAAFASLRVLFEQMEAWFSRFRNSSLLSRLNRGETIDDARFARACRMAIDAFEFTGGLFNPLVLPALEAAGYDRTFHNVQGGAPRAIPAPDPRDALALRGDSVALRNGRMDLGGIVKGWTVDLAIELVSGGFENVLVNAGGDMRAAGAEPGVNGWKTGVLAPGGATMLWEGSLRGALATSTTIRRRWITDSGRVAHHLIDPRSGLPAESPYVQVSAWERQTWRAECWAKALLIGGEAACTRATSQHVAFLASTPEGEVDGSPPPASRD